jgi:hypothetical protein
MTNLDTKRLSDVVLEDQRTTSQFVERQFPGIYREEGRELIELVKSYYRFLESETNQSVRNIRQIYQYRDIDKTLDSMLLYFKNKFLNGLFFEEDSRFIVKHILDLYRRKGSREGIELFFRLFFEDEIDVYYPSFDMFKPSQSSWKEGKYLQLNAVTDTSIFGSAVNKKVYGSISGAEAYVDNVFFINIRSSIVPIVFISSVRGQFQNFDTVFSTEPFTQYGIIYGSLNRVNVEQVNTDLFSSDNRVGDRVEILSTNDGLGAKGRVSKINESISGELLFSIDDGGFAYTVNGANTVSESIVLISEQLIFLDNTNQDFILEEKVMQINSANTEVIGIVVGQNQRSIGIVLDSTAPDANSDTYYFESGIDIETIDRDINITKLAQSTTDVNDSATFEVAELTNAQTVSIITDVISNFLDVELDDLNYNNEALQPFSGANTVFIDTPLNEAFEPETFEIGTISKLKSINPGSNYQGDAFILVKEPLFSSFNLKNQILTITPTNVNFLVGDIVTQEREMLSFEGMPETITVKGQVVAVSETNLFVKSLTFQRFVTSPPTVFKQGIPIAVSVVAVSDDQNSVQAGLNANILGDVSLSFGKIQEMDVVDSGFGYTRNEQVTIMNTDKTARITAQLEASNDPNEIATLTSLLENIAENGDATGIALVENQGFTEGKWVSFESHINQEKVIQDSYFYQDFSYEISTSIPVEVFEETYKHIVHPAGLKFFSKFAKTDTINTTNNIISSHEEDFGEVVNTSEFLETANNGFIYLITEE